MTTEYACLLLFDDGRSVVGTPSSLAYCKLAVQSQSSDKARWNPRAVRVMQRTVSEWSPLDESSEVAS